MKSLRPVFYLIAITALLSLAGCKAQQQMQQQLADLEVKVADSQKRIMSLDNELKKSAAERNEIKGLITKLGDVVVNLQRAEEERQQKAAQEAAARAKKPAAKKRR